MKTKNNASGNAIRGNPLHLELIRGEVASFNRWRADHNEYADLRTFDLSGLNLSKADLRYADLQWADLSRANLSHAQLFHADLFEANLTNADLTDANMAFSNLTKAVCRATNLRNTDISYSQIVSTILDGADISGCRVFGTSAWDLNLDNTTQNDLVISRSGEPIVTVDSLEMSQFIYLLLNNRKIRNVIDTITSKVVLILGRFSPVQMPLLRLIRLALRTSTRSYVPVLFDFDRPLNQDFIETVSTLAHMSRFVLADVTDARIVLEELPHIVRSLSVPVVPLLRANCAEPVTLYNLRRNHRSLLETVVYDTDAQLIEQLPNILSQLEERVQHMRST